MFQAESYKGHKLCWPDDLVINSLWAWSRGLGIAQHHGIISTAYSVYRLRNKSKVLPQYINGLVRSSPFQWEMQVRSKGIWISRLQLTDDSFLDAPFPLPPSDEQAAIVRFLDHADRRISRTIAAKQRLIKLLQEQKQVIIHQAVTRGLDPDVKLKPSGVEWLGDVPKGWTTLLFGRVIKGIEQGWSPVAADGDLAEDQWAVLTLAAIKKGTFHGDAVKPIALSAAVPTKLELHTDDLLLTRSNTRELVGDVCLVKEPRHKTLFSDLIYRISLNNKKVESRYIVYQLLSPSLRLQIGRDARGSSGTMPKLAHMHIKSWRVVMPPLEDQRVIAGYLDSRLVDLSEAGARAQQEIALLREYRTRLIADVVTGKLDVREAVAGLSELDAEPLPADLEPEDGDLEGEDAEAEADAGEVVEA